MPLPEHVYTADDYWALPEGVRAELIDGELWDLASPSRIHQKIVAELVHATKSHISSHGGSCEVYPAPFAVNLFADETTFVEPDLSVVCDRSKLSDRGCEGAPDMVVEVVSPGNPGMDYISKLALYRDAGVREYWICDPRRRRTHRYAFESEGLVEVYDFDEPVPSVVLSGFEASLAAMLADAWEAS